MLVPVLLSGGDGKRLWPASRQTLPKQFINFTNPNKSLFQTTAERINDLKIHKSGLIVISNEDHRFLVAEQLHQININLNKIILEPIARNTAPAVALAALEALNKYSTAKLLIQTSDHIIPDLNYFNSQINKAYKADFPIVTFGITPTRPEIGFGYIEVGDAIKNSCLFEIKRFTEKPNIKKAEAFIKKNNYLWNSGMFLIDAKTYLEELEKFEPNILYACKEALEKSVIDLDFTRINKEAFMKAPNKSIDYAVIERSKKIAVLPYEESWTDLGSWDSLFEYLPIDKNGNFVNGDCFLSETTNSMVWSESKLVTTIGVKNLIIIETPDAILVTNKKNTQKVKCLVNNLKELNRIEASDHTRGYRPWGTYLSVCRNDNYQVKIIEVDPKKSLSLQLHHHRAEHWIVVEGIAEVLNGDQKLRLKKNQSTFIPVGVKHRLSNPSVKKLRIIEVQSGSYLGEDDIVRFDDKYGRS